MGNLYWNNEKISDTPFWLQSFDLNIYSLEELCYLIRKKTMLVDRSMMTDELLLFLEEKLSVQVHDLRQMVHFNGSLAGFCEELLQHSQFPVSVEEWGQIKETLRENELLTPFVRMVRQADMMFSQKHYFKAFHAYAKNIALAGEQAQRGYLLGQMAKCAFFLFHYDVAAEFFLKSYQECQDEKSMLGYLLCKRFMMSKQQYVSFATQNQEYYELILQAERVYEQAKQKAQLKVDTMLAMPGKNVLINEFREMMD